MLRRTLATLLAACLLVAPAAATWSIVVVNRRTGEVAIGVATCLQQSNLTLWLPVIINGVGAGIIQSSGAPGRLAPMAAALRAGLTPEEVLAEITMDGGPGLQIGIAAMSGPPITYDGVGVGAARFGIAAEAGDLAYAIQGNVLAGAEVIRQAERALLDAEGDLSQKLLAGMVAARQYGGDGRCSCILEGFGNDANDCGSPPPDFDKSAHSAALLLARVGDLQAPCVSPNGADCANSGYYLRLVIRGANAQIPDPDPVDQLVQRYAEWRAARAGRPDALNCRVSSVAPLPADGRTRRRVTVTLVDVEGDPLTTGSARLTVEPAGTARALAGIGEVRNHGDGTYSFDVIAADRPAVERFAIRASDDLVDTQLWPLLEVRTEPLRLR